MQQSRHNVLYVHTLCAHTKQNKTQEVQEFPHIGITGLRDDRCYKCESKVKPCHVFPIDGVTVSMSIDPQGSKSNEPTDQHTNQMGHDSQQGVPEAMAVEVCVPRQRCNGAGAQA